MPSSIYVTHTHTFQIHAIFHIAVLNADINQMQGVGYIIFYKKKEKKTANEEEKVKIQI